MESYIWFIFLGFSILFFAFSFKYKNEYPSESHIVMIVATFFMLMCGLFVLTLGVQFTSPNATYNITDTQIIVSHSTYTLQGSLSQSYGLSWALIMLAFAMGIITALSWRDYSMNKRRNITYSEEE